MSRLSYLQTFERLFAFMRNSALFNRLNGIIKIVNSIYQRNANARPLMDLQLELQF